MKKIVISGINIFQAGALTIYKEVLDALISGEYLEENQITIFVHKKDIFEEYQGFFEIIELPYARKNYAFRLYYEYIFFYFYSRGKFIDVWISLHDMTPNVHARNRYVYCHNPLPFIDKKIRKKINFGCRDFLLQKIYKYAYMTNIKKNTAVIVQQEWLRREFRSKFGVKRIIVSRPSAGEISELNQTEALADGRYKFIYPAYPRVFKNFELICRSAKILEEKGMDFEVMLTMKGTENKYAQNIFLKYKDLKNIRWVGFLDRKELEQKYFESDCMLFPSFLETWGLPITEFKQYGKPVLCADLPYSHETVGNYQKVKFFNPVNERELAQAMADQIRHKEKYDGNKAIEYTGLTYDTWPELLSELLK